MVEPKVIIEALTTVAGSGILEVSKPRHEQPEPGANAPAAIEDTQAALISKISIHTTMETHESHPIVSTSIDPSCDMHMFYASEETVLD